MDNLPTNSRFASIREKDVPTSVKDLLQQLLKWLENDVYGKIVNRVNWLLNGRPYAEIYVVDNSTAQSIPTGTTYTKLTSFSTNGLYNQCTPDADNGKITVLQPGHYKLKCSVSAKSDTVSTFIYAVFVDGVEQDNIHSHRKYGNANDAGNNGCCGLFNVTSENTDVDLRARHDNGGAVNLTITYMNLTLYQVGNP